MILKNAIRITQRLNKVFGEMARFHVTHYRSCVICVFKSTEATHFEGMRCTGTFQKHGQPATIRVSNRKLLFLNIVLTASDFLTHADIRSPAAACKLRYRRVYDAHVTRSFTLYRAVSLCIAHDRQSSLLRPHSAGQCVVGSTRCIYTRTVPIFRYQRSSTEECELCCAACALPALGT